MAIYTCLLLAASCLYLASSTRSVVIPRPPPSYQVYRPSTLARYLNVATSSELPKQIPAPSQPPHHSSTPQYMEEEQQIPGTTRLVWVTQEMGTSAPMQTTRIEQRTDLMPNILPKQTTKFNQKTFEQRIDLMPNMV